MAKGKKKAASNKPQRKMTGSKVMLWNMSQTPQYCAGSGRKLPMKGMVVLHNGRYYIDYRTAESAL